MDFQIHLKAHKGNHVKKIRRKDVRQALAVFISLMMMVSFQNCTGGGFSTGADLSSSNLSSSTPPTGDSPQVPGPVQGPNPSPVPMPAPESLPTPVAVGEKITDIRIVNKSANEQLDVPITFGQVFRKGAISPASPLAGKLSNGSVIPLQVDVKTKHTDGSLRHAVISAIVPKLAKGQTEVMEILNSNSGPGNGAGPGADSLVAAGFSAGIQINLAGTVYSASADSLLKSASKKSWLSGPISNEWLLVAPLKTSAGVEHPHLTARFSVRSFLGQNRAKVDMTIENAWAYEPNPQNFTYDVEMSVGGQVVYSKLGLAHFHHTRWKKSFWWGEAPLVHIKHNTAYIISTRAVPNYDQSVVMSESAIASQYLNFKGPKTEPMGPGIAMAAMPTTGGRPDIGLNPAWVTMYLLSGDERMKEISLATSDLAGSWSIHYRDKKTDRSLSIMDYPYATLVGTKGDTYNPITKQYEIFPACGGTCTNTNQADVSHQPNFSYIPYMLSGEHYHMEELNFWAAYMAFNSNPGYRMQSKGLVKSEQMRGQAWAMRTMADAAYILPDDVPFKQALVEIVNNNLEHYNLKLTNEPTANKLGFNSEGGYTVVYNNGLGLAPWMDDFFTQAIGHVAELGFEKAKPLLAWKAKFPIGRMTAPGYCWIDGAVYAMNVRDAKTSPYYETFAEAYQASLRNADGTPLALKNGVKYLDQPCASQAAADWRTQYDLETGAKRPPWLAGEMTGYSPTPTGYPSNMQPALAYAVDSGAPDSAKAWQIFLNRAAKPDYSTAPQFNIIPR